MNIISEKKALRKTYADERARLDSELLRVSMNAAMVSQKFSNLLELGLGEMCIGLWKNHLDMINFTVLMYQVNQKSLK
jgi:hypothetical protein